MNMVILVRRATKKLGIWVEWQRQSYKRGAIKADRKERLERLGFCWVVDEAKVWQGDRDTKENDTEWDRMFEILQVFHSQMGHCFVAVVERDKNKLGR